MSINGTALSGTTYLYTSAVAEEVTPSDVRFQGVASAGRIFVMGDHRDASTDSRCHLTGLSSQGQGQAVFVPITDVVGPAINIASPLDRTRRLRTPTTFCDVTAAAAPAPVKAKTNRSA